MQPKQRDSASKSWFAGVLTFGLLAMGASGALASFGPQILPRGAWISPFTWDAPTRTIARDKSLEKGSGRTATVAVFSPAGEVVVLDDWNYTAICRGRPEPSLHY